MSEPHTVSEPQRSSSARRKLAIGASWTASRLMHRLKEGASFDALLSDENIIDCLLLEQELADVPEANLDRALTNRLVQVLPALNAWQHRDFHPTVVNLLLDAYRTAIREIVHVLTADRPQWEAGTLDNVNEVLGTIGCYVHDLNDDEEPAE